MKDQVLSIKQMQKLKELGIDISKASMCYVFFESDSQKYTDIVVHDESCYEMACMNPIPTFTLQDIIELMPESITINGLQYNLLVCISLIEYSAEDKNEVPIHYVSKANDILGNAYNMLVWLAENKYI